MAGTKPRYHPWLFLLMTLVAIAELGLTAFLIDAGNASHTWPTPRYHSLLILFLFNAVWTTMFAAAYVLWIIDGAVHVLASMASSIIWLLISTILWGTAAGVMHNTRSGGNCSGVPSISRPSLTVESLGWTEFGLCCITLLLTALWMRTSNRSYVSDYRGIV
ncbi:hypothetical protein PLICRDRAFT_153903 [Plicaturopsis crispa FD-325 SS-3]|nr:hypothetical protein PLICRDRAFT_153903 [Plicaturopsis crispa FD-325 SS-3]